VRIVQPPTVSLDAPLILIAVNSEVRTFKCDVTGGDPQPMQVLWTLDDEPVGPKTEAVNILTELTVKVTAQVWNGKVLKCSVAQEDTQVRI
jgi:hypothetical protein